MVSDVLRFLLGGVAISGLCQVYVRDGWALASAPALTPGIHSPAWERAEPGAVWGGCVHGRPYLLTPKCIPLLSFSALRAAREDEKWRRPFPRPPCPGTEMGALHGDRCWRLTPGGDSSLKGISLPETRGHRHGKFWTAGL